MAMLSRKSNEKRKTTSYFPLYWLFNMDRYFMVYENYPHITNYVVESPIYPKQVVFFLAHIGARNYQP